MSEPLSISDAIKQNGFIVHTFHGISMMPMLRQNRDAVRLIFPLEKPRRDDVALFSRKNGELVLHRVIKAAKDGYIIRGDNCISGEYVPESRIIAVAEGIYRDGVYLPCTDKKVMRYAKLQRLTLPFRYVLTKSIAVVSAILKKIFRK